MLRLKMVSPKQNAVPVEALWSEFATPLKRFLRAKSASEADADDLLQEVFLRIQRRLPDLRDPARLQGWVYRIARNTLIDHYRGRRPLDLLADDGLEDDSLDGRETVDLTPSMRRFLASLPDGYREPLVRHVFQGQEMQEIAVALGLSLTATKSRIRRAKLMLREMLDQCCRFEFDRRGKVIEAIPRSCNTPVRPLA